MSYRPSLGVIRISAPPQENPYYDFARVASHIPKYLTRMFAASRAVLVAMYLRYGLARD